MVNFLRVIFHLAGTKIITMKSITYSILLSVIVVIFLFLTNTHAQQPNQVQSNVLLEQIDKQNKKIETLQNEVYLLKTSGREAVLSETVEILNKTNEALTQRWTPISATLTGLSVIFAVITILWGVVFAFGYTAYKAIEKQKNQMIKDSSDLRKKGKEVIEYFEKEGTKIVSDKSKSLEDMKKELKDFQTNATKAIERLQESALVSVSGHPSSLFSTFRISSEPGIGVVNAKVCSRCGNLFTDENISPISAYGWSENISIRSFSTETLCKRCREPALKLNE